MKAPIVALLALLGFAVGCASPAVNSTNGAGASEPATEPALIDALSVRMVADQRPLQGRTSIGAGLVGLLPLVPFGREHIGLEHFIGGFSIPVLGRIVTDVQATGLVRDVFDKEDLVRGRKVPQHPYELLVTLTQGSLQRDISLYCLSFAGVFPWMLGLPTAYDTMKLGFTMELRDPSHTLLGTKTFDLDQSFAEGLYYHWPSTVAKRFDVAFRTMTPELDTFLRGALEKERTGAAGEPDSGLASEPMAARISSSAGGGGLVRGPGTRYQGGDAVRGAGAGGEIPH